MIQNTQTPKLMTLFVSKVFSFNNGALALLAAPFGIGFTEAFKGLFKNVSVKELHTPLFASCVVLMLFLLFFVMDFFTGLAASRKESESKDFIQSAKLWRSFWKLYGFTTLLIFFAAFCIVCAVIENEFLYNFFLYSILTIGFMFSMFEFHSIGENWARMYGRKHRIFLFFDKITKTVETRIIDKINNF